ncbi:unnamed protein product [Sphagnum jensenii]|uniref:OTU domain-containing protein n=1 Tax=Sphagnum jensenii TaxID=128206 RepID=A0ABP0WRB8_9BRYO
MRMGLKTGLNHIRRRHKLQDKFKAPDITNLNEQLSLLGLKIHPVTADGNCFYRAVADQLEGNEEAHGKYRHLAVDYIQDHREEFEPFVEDEVPFDEYCKTMRDDGTWAGHMELQATSLVTHHNICIHQLMTPRWQILNFESADACTLHLSYHDGEHYNSVRRLDDFGIGPAQPITIEADATPTTEPPPPKDKVDDTYADTGESPLQAVMEVTGNTNVDQVQEVLYRVDGVPDAAVEVLLDEQSLSGNISPSHTWETSSNSSETSGDYGHYSPIRSSGSDEGESTTSQASSHLTDGTSPTPYNVTDVTSPNPYQGISRNSACPCGSGKKYKYCCGTSRAKSTFTLVSRAEELLTNKLKKPMSMLPKVHHHSGKPAPSPPPGPPPEVVDMGALCI